MFHSGLKTKIALVIVIPLTIEICFLVSLLSVLGELQKERVAENMTMETLAAVDILLNDTVSCGHVMLFRPYGEPLTARYDQLKADQRNFKRLIAKGAPECPSLNQFVEAVEKLIGACEMVNINSPDDVWRSGVADKVRESTWQITTTGEQVIKELSEIRERQARASSHAEETLREGIALATVCIIVVALLAVFYIVNEFGRAFSTLRKNTELIARQKPLLPPISGSGELSRLDALIHTLSSQLDEKRRKERTLIEHSSVLICSLDVELMIVDISPAAEKLLGYKRMQLVGERLVNLLDANEKQQVIKAFQRCRDSSQLQEFECQLKGKKHNMVFTEWTVQWSQREQNYFCTVQDNSARKEAERLKSEVVAMVSHDLRSPLSSLLVSFDMMGHGLAGKFSEQGQAVIGETKKAISSLMALINDLIDVEKFESESFVPHYEIVRIKNLINETVGKVGGVSEKNLSVTVESDDLDVKGDPDQLGRVLKILLRNAIVRSNENGKIAVRCQRRPEQSDQQFVQIGVTDSGKRLSEEQQQQLFERISPTGKDSAEVGADSRLSFVLSRAIIEAHNGDIGIDAVAHGTTTFWFKIPIQ